MMNKDSQLIKLMSRIDRNYQLLSVLNAPTDLLYLYNSLSKSIEIFDITHVTAVIENTNLESRLVFKICDLVDFNPLNVSF